MVHKNLPDGGGKNGGAGRGPNGGHGDEVLMMEVVMEMAEAIN